MISILIAEDERLEREALRRLIQANFNDEVDEVISVNNGQKAIEYCRYKHFDLIITDINMPLVSGLEVLREAKRLNPSVKTIILTGYDYFQYAQEAIRIGVDDFILKPASDEETCQCIQRVLQQMSEDQQKSITFQSRFQEIQAILQSDLIYTILYHENEQQIQKFFSIMHLEVQSAFCLCINRSQLNHKVFDECISYLNKQYACCLYEPYFEHIVVFIFHNKLLNAQDCNEVKNYLHEHLKECGNIGVGSIKQNKEEFYDSYVEAREQELQKVIVNVEDEQQRGLLQFLCDEFQLAIINGDIEHYEQIASLFKKMCVGVNKAKIQELLIHFFDMLKVELVDQFHADITVLQEKSKQISCVNNLEEAYLFLVHVLQECMYPIIEQRRSQMNKLIVAAYEFIEQNYQKAIGLNDLAAALEVTPQYISSLLTQQTSSTFTNILAQYRISKAKTLLANDYIIKEVATLVGFQNQNYFAKTFKKITGYTPNEYKSRF